MRVKYFSDTDTALVEFTGNEVSETREISESIYVDLDSAGNLVGDQWGATGWAFSTAPKRSVNG